MLKEDLLSVGGQERKNHEQDYRRNSSKTICIVMPVVLQSHQEKRLKGTAAKPVRYPIASTFCEQDHPMILNGQIGRCYMDRKPLAHRNRVMNRPRSSTFRACLCLRVHSDSGSEYFCPAHRQRYDPGPLIRSQTPPAFAAWPLS